VFHACNKYFFRYYTLTVGKEKGYGKMFEDDNSAGENSRLGKWETLHSSLGYSVTVWTWEDLKRSRATLLNSVFYLYPSIEEADEGVAAGGTGFFISVPLPNHPEHGMVYAVTNDHVIHEGKSTVIRLNTVSGEKDTIPLSINQWRSHPAGDDLAVAQILIMSHLHQYQHTPTTMLVTPEIMKNLDIGVGDEVYMLGRFALHEGKEQNKPVVRSGLISLMPDSEEKIDFKDGRPAQEAFLVEMRSLSGFSGSPVIFDVPLQPREIIERERKITPDGWNLSVGPWILGIDCGSLRWREKVYNVERQRGEVFYNKTDLVAESHSGFSAVIPAWKLNELLNLEEFIVARQEKDELIERHKRQSPASRDVLLPDNDRSEGLTPEGFEEALRRASRKVSQPESETKETSE
jgi:hypothetical protein